MAITGHLYVIAAPSGAGKTSLVKRLLTCLPDIEVSVSHTTRSRRAGEKDGVDYYFVDRDTFCALVQEGVFLEHAKVFDYDYGTSRYAVLEQLRAGVDVILEIDWQGARQVRASSLDAHSIFILPPSQETLRQRLLKRGQDDPEVIERRMRDAVNQIVHYNDFDYIVVNDDFAKALDALCAIIVANRQRRDVQTVRQHNLIQNLLS
jgi:guanylate kinase